MNQKKNTCYSLGIPLDGEPWTAPSAPSRLTQPWHSLNLIYELLQGWLSVFDLWVFRCGLLPSPSSDSLQMENMLHYLGHQHETTCPTFSYRDVNLTLLMLKARLKNKQMLMCTGGQLWKFPWDAKTVSYPAGKPIPIDEDSNLWAGIRISPSIIHQRSGQKSISDLCLENPPTHRQTLTILFEQRLNTIDFVRLPS